jgi:hypothetical protein
MYDYINNNKTWMITINFHIIHTHTSYYIDSKTEQKVQTVSIYFCPPLPQPPMLSTISPVGAFISTDESALTFLQHHKSMVGTGASSWYCSLAWGRYIMPLIFSAILVSHRALPQPNNQLPLLIHLSLPASATPDLSSSLWICLFQNVRVRITV